MRKLLNAALIVMLMACICIGGALFVQAQDEPLEPAEHVHDWTYDYPNNTATCVADGCTDNICNNHIAGEWQQESDLRGHYRTCTVCNIKMDQGTCSGGASPDCQTLPVCEVCDLPYDGEYGAHIDEPVPGRHEEDTDHYHVLIYPCCDDPENPKHPVVQAHTEGTAANCHTATLCAVCGNQYGEIDPDNHASSSEAPEWQPLNATHHKVVCGCEEAVTLDTALHRGGTASCSKQAICADCGVAYGGFNDVHTYSNDCDADCNDCGAARTPAEHAFGEWEVTKKPTEGKTGEQKRVCAVCGKEQTATIAAITNPNASAEPEPAGLKTGTVVLIGVVVAVVAMGVVLIVISKKKKK